MIDLFCLPKDYNISILSSNASFSWAIEGFFNTRCSLLVARNIIIFGITAYFSCRFLSASCLVLTLLLVLANDESACETPSYTVQFHCCVILIVTSQSKYFVIH